jgi:hypothetical protein
LFGYIPVLTVGHPVEILHAPPALVPSGTKNVCTGAAPPLNEYE